MNVAFGCDDLDRDMFNPIGHARLTPERPRVGVRARSRNSRPNSYPSLSRLEKPKVLDANVSESDPPRRS